MQPYPALLAQNLRRCRESRGMSLGDLAAASGLSKATAHALELGDGNPTLSTLWALASALAVPLGELLDDSAPSVTVVRSGGGPVVVGDAVRARLMHRVGASRSVEVYDLTLETVDQISAAHRPGVAELIVVVEGKVMAGPANESIELSQGDSAYFEASVNHRYGGVGSNARALLLMIYR